MNRCRLAIVAATALVATSSTHAADWKNANGGNWAYAPWWSTGVIPAPGEAVNITTAAFSDYAVTANTSYTADAPLGNVLVNSNRPLEITLNLTDIHSDFYTANETIGDAGRATVKHTGHTTNGVSGSLVLGKSATGRGIYNMNGLSLIAGVSEVIGRAGTGTFTQNSGTNTIDGTGADGGLHIGELAGGVGSFTLNGGTLTVASNELVGVGGRGTFLQAGGTNSAPLLVIAALHNASGGDYTMGGGTLQATSVENHGSFNQTAGSATLGFINNSGVFTAQGGTLAITNGFSNSGTATIGGTQAWATNTTFFDAGGNTTFNTDAGSATNSPLAVQVGEGTVTFAAAQHLASLNLTSNGTATIAKGTRSVVTVNHLSFGDRIAGALGHLDITDNELVIRNGDLATVAARIAAGGITSSAADAAHRVGYRAIGDGVDVVYALAGDANLDGAVNFSDLVAVAQSYNTKGTFWASGDFDYDRATNFTDLVTLAQNYNTGTPAIGDARFGASFAADWAMAQSLVPEPTALSLLALPLVVSRRSRRSAITSVCSRLRR